MANALLEANKVLSGPRLEGTAPVSRTTLLSMILRNASTDELIRNLAASGHAYGSAVASLVTVVGDDDNMVEGSYFQLLGDLWRGRYRCTDVWPAASEKGAATVSIKIAGEQLIFPGNRSPRNYSAWINGLDSGYVQLHDKDGRPVDTTRWPETIGCSIRCILLPVAEDKPDKVNNSNDVDVKLTEIAPDEQLVDSSLIAILEETSLEDFLSDIEETSLEDFLRDIEETSLEDFLNDIEETSLEDFLRDIDEDLEDFF